MRTVYLPGGDAVLLADGVEVTAMPIADRRHHRVPDGAACRLLLLLSSLLETFVSIDFGRDSDGGPLREAKALLLLYGRVWVFSMETMA